MYLTYEDYVKAGGKLLTEENAEKHLQRASENIDTLTFNRIVGIGFENLTPFQQDLVKRTTFLQAEFLCENEDLTDTYVDSYSINGVSTSFGSKNLRRQDGVLFPATAWCVLEQTGLCRRGF